MWQGAGRTLTEPFTTHACPRDGLVLHHAELADSYLPLALSGPPAGGGTSRRLPAASKRSAYQLDIPSFCLLNWAGWGAIVVSRAP